MVPLIHPDDRIKDIVPKKSYQIDDLVVFQDNKQLIAHRIIYQDPHRPKEYLAKGDNNRKSDNWIKHEQILGVVKTIARAGHSIKIEDLYHQQAISYQTELEAFAKLAKKYHLHYLILKGIPIYVKYKKNPPRHFLFDADILIKKSELKKLKIILAELNYQRENWNERATQFSVYKKGSKYPICLDIHLEPAVAFTQIPQLNALLPQISPLTKLMWSLNKDRFLDVNLQYIYLLLHAYHHNYQGVSRWNLINAITKNDQFNPDSIYTLINKLELENLMYGPLTYLNIYYPHKQIKNLVKKLTVRNSTKWITRILVKYIKPWDQGKPLLNRLSLLTQTVILSPLSLKKKIQILFQASKSIDVSFFKNWFTSARA